MLVIDSEGRALQAIILNKLIFNEESQTFLHLFHVQNKDKFIEHLKKNENKKRKKE